MAAELSTSSFNLRSHVGQESIAGERQDAPFARRQQLRFHRAGGYQTLAASPPSHRSSSPKHHGSTVAPFPFRGVAAVRVGFKKPPGCGAVHQLPLLRVVQVSEGFQVFMPI